jgi:hypothetical protein
MTRQLKLTTEQSGIRKAQDAKGQSPKLRVNEA